MERQRQGDHGCGVRALYHGLEGSLRGLRASYNVKVAEEGSGERDDRAGLCVKALHHGAELHVEELRESKHRYDEDESEESQLRACLVEDGGREVHLCARVPRAGGRG